MEEPPKATKLTEVFRSVQLEPLGWGDSRYVDVSAGRGDNALKEMRNELARYDAAANRFAQFAFTGHRGSGKSTELLRLEHDFRDRFTPLHIAADETLIKDLDYTDLFLWLVDELVREFEKAGTPLNPRVAEDVADWFAEVTLTDVEEVKKEVAVETEARTGAKASLFGLLSLGLFAKIKSRVMGNADSRKEIRKKLQNNATDLVARVNGLLDHAHTTLKKHGRPADLLIVVDNLDRLPPEVSQPLFFKNGDFLKQLRAHVIYTVPIATDLAPDNIATVFSDCFPFSMVKVRKQDGKVNKAGIDAFEAAVARRIEIPAVFSKRQDVRKLAEMSGGSIRDLMRLIRSAQRIALADDKPKIDTATVKRAVLGMRLEYERIFIPSRVYYPLLAQIHLTKKGEGFEGETSADPETAKKYRVFFNQFLFNGSVLAYNGDSMWYDVHPVIQEIDAFQKALAHAKSAAQPETPA